MHTTWIPVHLYLGWHRNLKFLVQPDLLLGHFTYEESFLRFFETFHYSKLVENFVQRIILEACRPFTTDASHAPLWGAAQPCAPQTHSVCELGWRVESAASDGPAPGAPLGKHELP